jgi:hypothetical protein
MISKPTTSATSEVLLRMPGTADEARAAGSTVTTTTWLAVLNSRLDDECTA